MCVISCGSAPYGAPSQRGDTPAIREQCERYARLLRRHFSRIEFCVVRWELKTGSHLDVVGLCDTTEQEDALAELPLYWAEQEER